MSEIKTMSQYKIGLNNMWNGPSVSPAMAQLWGIDKSRPEPSWQIIPKLCATWLSWLNYEISKEFIELKTDVIMNERDFARP